MMTNKTMPERITVQELAYGEFRAAETIPSYTLPVGIAESQYIRADLASGGINEPLADCQSDAIRDVINERQKQIAKGYDAAHDDADMKGNHARAGSYYVAAARGQRCFGFDLVSTATEYADYTTAGYPRAPETKAVEADPRSNLVEAAALLIAEIERIDREESIND